MKPLHERVALVTGASRGIGREAALALAEQGTRVAVCSRSEREIQKVAEEIGGVAVRCDVASADSVAAAVREVTEKLGPVDILVNNAGVSSSNLIERTTDEQWDAMLDTNLRGAFYLTRAVVGGMKGSGFGRIVNVASRAGRQGSAYVTAYCASKFGLVGLTLALAAELEGTGVTANAVCPGWVDTEMARRSVSNITAKTGQSEAEATAQIAAMNRSGRLLSPAEVAAAVAALCVGSENGKLIDME